MELQITDQNFESLVAEGKPIVIDFWATWCAPCKRLGPIIEELAAEYETINFTTVLVLDM